MQEFWLAKRAEHVFTESSRVYEFQRVCNQTEISEEKKLHELAGNAKIFGPLVLCCLVNLNNF